MKGLPSSSHSSGCFGNITNGTILCVLKFCCPFRTPATSTGQATEREKEYKHVPTHAASSFLRTTTPPVIRRAAESIFNDITLSDLDPELVMAIYDEGLAEVVVAHGGITDGTAPAGRAEDRYTPEVAASDELRPDKGPTDEAIKIGSALNEQILGVTGAGEVSVISEADIGSLRASCSDIAPLGPALSQVPEMEPLNVGSPEIRRSI